MSPDAATRLPVQPRRRMAAAERRTVIVEAARAAFAEGGFHQTSLDAVAERAGVSKALIYEHFGSKRELHATMLEGHVDELIERITGAVADGEPGEDRLRRGVEAFLDFVEERRGVWRIMFRNPTDPDVAGSLERLRSEIGLAVTLLMREEAETFHLDDPDLPQLVEMVAQQLIGSLQSLADWWDENREVPREQVLRVAMSFIWLGSDRIASGERWIPRNA